MIGNLSLSTIKRMVRRRKRGDVKAPFGVVRIGRAVRIVRHEFLAAINNGIARV